MSNRINRPETIVLENGHVFINMLHIEFVEYDFKKQTKKNNLIEFKLFKIAIHYF